MFLTIIKSLLFFDDNPNIHKKFLNGVRIFNPQKSFSDIIKKYNIKYAIIGINKLPEQRRIDFIQQCLDHQVKVLKVPSTENWLNNTLQIGQLTDINFEDLLNRAPIKLDQEVCESEYYRKSGIGNRLCRLYWE